MYNFTLIIPTHNRHNYLNRSIEYFKSLDADVIYCDSSSKEYKGELSNNMKYLHLPNKKFAEKILISLEKINTDFVALCADDDFIIIESLCKGSVFLAKNNNYSTVLGKYIAFNENFDGNYYNLYQELPKDIDFSPSKNAEEFFQNYYQILWAMYDKKVLVKAFHIIYQAQFLNDNFIELVIGAYACYQGGLKFQNEIWGVRELNVQDHWGARTPEITKKDCLEFKNDYKVFEELLDNKTFPGYAEVVLTSYFKYQKVNEYSFRSIVKIILPKVILRYIKMFLQKITFLQIKKSNKKPSTKIQQPIIVDLLETSQLNEITSILNSNNKF